MPVVAAADAVPDPRAVVVEVEDAGIAQAAVEQRLLRFTAARSANAASGRREIPVVVAMSTSAGGAGRRCRR